jgi:hypothetical protein
VVIPQTAEAQSGVLVVRYVDGAPWSALRTRMKRIKPRAGDHEAQVHSVSFNEVQCRFEIDPAAAGIEVGAAFEAATGFIPQVIFSERGMHIQAEQSRSPAAAT